MSEAHDAIPADPAEVDLTWMQQALDGAGVAAGAHLEAVHFGGYIGTGQMGRNARYRLVWDAPDGRPSSVVGKFPTDDPTGRATGFGNHSYRNEFAFYQRFVHTVRVRAPHCHVARFDEPGQNFVLLMEDLSGSAQGDQMRGLRVDEAALAVEQAVALHAPRWGDPNVVEVMHRTPDESRTMLHAIYEAVMEGTLARLGPVLDDDAIALVRAFAPRVGEWTGAVTAPATVLHMDFRPDNLLFGVAADAPPLVVVDWQTVTAGPGTHDVAYLIGGSFEPDERARVEHDLVREYCERLQAEGIHYSAADGWRDYRVSSLWGVAMSVIATMLAAQTERGDVMLSTMLRRHARHALDLDALSLLG